MANNIVQYIADLKAHVPKRSNWDLSKFDVGTNTFGFIKPRLVKEVIAGSRVTYDFQSAYSSNPTISPVLSRAKVSVCAIWVPLSLYVPAFRDGEPVKAGKTDYSFPTISTIYSSARSDYNSLFNITTNDYPDILKRNGLNQPYVPANSIFSDLKMYAPYYQPFADSSNTAKNAVPLLAYYDFFRHYVMNTQSDEFPLRTQGYSVRNSFVQGTDRRVVQEPIDVMRSRSQLDDLFSNVRRDGMSYQMNGVPFDISGHFSVFLGGQRRINGFLPSKKLYVDFSSSGSAPDPLSLVAFNDDHFGEVRQTYLGDYFIGYLGNDNVEYERNTASVVADDGGVITMEQIYLARCVQNFIRRSVFKNSDYAEFIDAQYDVTPPTNLTKPLFLGKVSTWLHFNDVTSMATTSNDTDVDSNSVLGSRASLAFARMESGKYQNKKNRHFVSFTAKEPGYFMVLEWIVPEVSYFQGFDPLYLKNSLEDLFYPDFDKLGYQDKQFKLLNEQIQNSAGFKGVPPTIADYNIAYAQEPAWWEYMQTYNTLSGQMVDEGVYRHWVFHREIEPSHTEPDYQGNTPVDFDNEWTGDVVRELTNIYVTPEEYQHIFTNEQGLDNFHTYYNHNFKAYQPMSHRFLSY